MAKKITKLELGESLSIEHTAKLKKEFDKALKEGVQLALHAGLITAIDLSGIQLLEYMIHQAATKKAELQFKYKPEEDLKELLLKSGFKSFTESVFA